MNGALDLLAAVRATHLVVLESYLDESFGHGFNRVYVVAGWLGNRAAWQSLEEPWRDRLRRAGIAEFKTSDSYNRTNAFKGWTIRRAENLRKRLIEIVLKAEIQGVVTVFYVDGEARKHTDYLVCIETCMRALASLCGMSEPRGETVAFVIDEKDKIKADVETTRLFIQERGHKSIRDRIGPAAFGSSERLIPLQAADMLACESYRAARIHSPIPKHWRAPSELSVHHWRDLEPKVSFVKHFWWDASSQRMRTWSGKRWHPLYATPRARANG